MPECRWAASSPGARVVEHFVNPQCRQARIAGLVQHPHVAVGGPVASCRCCLLPSDLRSRPPDVHWQAFGRLK
jgi:hypothetical protein